MNYFKWTVENRKGDIVMIQYNRITRYAWYKTYVGIPSSVIAIAKEMYDAIPVDKIDIISNKTKKGIIK